MLPSVAEIRAGVLVEEEACQHPPWILALPPRFLMCHFLARAGAGVSVSEGLGSLLLLGKTQGECGFGNSNLVSCSGCISQLGLL